ncbi:hypothetical protein FB451DRAFT_1289326 [Mycena latifolia]|nr:hypothetical protein FB451DRAFT_1289326 [Mycena latifolia]
MAVPGILGHTVIRAVDGLQFAGRNTLCAYRGGVTAAIVAPMGSGFLQGIRTAFSAGAPNALAYGAILQSKTALHISIHSEMRASVSTQIAALRNMVAQQARGVVSRPVRSRWSSRATLLLLNPNSKRRLPRLCIRRSRARRRHTTSFARSAPQASVSSSHPRARIPNPGTIAALFPALPCRGMTVLRHGVNVALGVQSEYGALRARLGRAGRRRRSRRPTSTRRSGSRVIYHGGGFFDLESKVLGVVSGRRAVVDLF